MHPLQHDRQILLAAIKEQLGLAETFENVDIRRVYVLEATRLGLRLMAVQEQIESEDLD